MSSATLRPPMAMPPGPVWRFTVDEYHRMIETGVLGDDDRVELIEGWILPKMPQNPEHMTAIGLLEDALRQTLPTGWCVRSQGPITTRDSEPEPDVVVARGQRIDYGHRHPGPNDLGLVVEISYTSLTFDRTAKAKMYARAGIGVYWIVNTDVREIEVYSEPDSAGATTQYRNRSVFTVSDSIPLILDGNQVATLPIRDLLPE